MFRPRIMTGKSCVFVFQFVSFLYYSVRSHLHAVLLPHSVFSSDHIDNRAIEISAADYAHFK
jgi:hypothetical protein